MKQNLMLCAALAAWAICAQAAETGRERLRFDDGWKFHLLDEAVGEPPISPLAGTPIEKWRWKTTTNAVAETLDVTRPDFVEGAGWKDSVAGQNMLWKENSFGWFRTTLPNAAKAPTLHFESADDNATVFLNGQKLTEHAGWDDPFDVNLAPAWKPNGPNIVTVLVENVAGGGGLGAAAFRSTEGVASPPVTEGIPAPNYDDKAWRDVHLPHDFIVEGTFDPKADVSHGFLPKAAGWYRKTFALPAADKGKTLWLEFDGVYRNSIVWLNGRQLGKHASGYTSFYYDISEAANFGGANTLAVFADARQNEGWWYEGGGIYRHVYLTKLAPVHIAHWGTYITATPSDDFKTATVLVRTDPEYNQVPANRIGVTWEVLAPDGKMVGAALDEDIPHGGRVAGARAARIHLANPQMWSPDTPNLYTLVTFLSDKGKLVDKERTTFGIRSLRWDADKGFFLNGKPFKIQGTCNHQDFAGLGVALPDRAHYYKIEKLKEMGSNAFRCSHNSMAPELLDACDRLGMVVMDENRKLGDSPEILAQVESMVRRDRNHPSVIMWSMCNEEGAQGSEAGAKQFSAMKAVVQKWDKTRPITAAENGGYGTGITLVTDLQGFNYHPGDYDAMHQKFPQLPMYGSETASEVSTRGIYANDKERGYVSAYSVNVPGWAQTSEAAWRALAEREFMAGGFVWTGFDYRGEPTPYAWPCVNSHFGILDTCGFPKDSFYYYKSWWGKAPVAHILPHWNWPGKEGQDIAVWVHGNAAKYELLLNGASLGTKEMPRNSHLEWKVKYAPGTLEARGYDAAGQQIVSDKVETTGPPAKLRLIPDREKFDADGEDVVMLRCEVLDAQDRIVPTADNEVTFSVNAVPNIDIRHSRGSAQIIGVGNGDPSSHEPDKATKRHAFNGLCLAIVQATSARSGPVDVTASSPGLQSATTRMANFGLGF